MKFSQPLAAKYKQILSSSKKIFLGRGSTVYTMDNKDANIEYQTVVGVGDQKWEIVEITIGISFFCLKFVFTTSDTGSFQVPPEKNHPHLRCQFPPKIPIWPKSLPYHPPSEKWLPPPPTPPITQSGGGDVNYVGASNSFTQAFDFATSAAIWICRFFKFQ